MSLALCAYHASVLLSAHSSLATCQLSCSTSRAGASLFSYMHQRHCTDLRAPSCPQWLSCRYSTCTQRCGVGGNCPQEAIIDKDRAVQDLCQRDHQLPSQAVRDVLSGGATTCTSSSAGPSHPPLPADSGPNTRLLTPPPHPVVQASPCCLLCDLRVGQGQAGNSRPAGPEPARLRAGRHGCHPCQRRHCHSPGRGQAAAAGDLHQLACPLVSTIPAGALVL